MEESLVSCTLDASLTNLVTSQCVEMFSFKRFELKVRPHSPMIVPHKNYRLCQSPSQSTTVVTESFPSNLEVMLSRIILFYFPEPKPNVPQRYEHSEDSIFHPLFIFQSQMQLHCNCSNVKNFAPYNYRGRVIRQSTFEGHK